MYPVISEATTMPRRALPCIGLSLALFLAATPVTAAQKRSIGVVPLPPSAAKSFYGNSWALIIGVNRYTDRRVPALQYAEEDAKAVRAALLRLGFPENNIRMLLGPKATRNAILRVVEEDLNPRWQGRIASSSTSRAMAPPPKCMKGGPATFFPLTPGFSIGP